MDSRKYFKRACQILILGYMALGSVSHAVIIGNPPYQSIKIPHSAFGYHFDMVQDHGKTLYVAYINGIKVFDGATWHYVDTGEESGIRRLYLGQDNRVYFGGSGIIGFVYKDEFGVYQFKDITPLKYRNNFADIWHMTECNNNIVFMSLRTVFLYNQAEKTVKYWDFSAKLGDGFCNKNKLIIQDRDIGLKELKDDIWVSSSIILKNNVIIDKFQKISDNNWFILSQSNDWRILQGEQIKHLQFKERLPALDNYVTSASLGDGKLVLGSNNGLLTFIDTNSSLVQSFQLTNEWISKIISNKDGELIILTEFEIYYLQWPSAIRIQSKGSGLASSLLDAKQWNNQLYLASSAGVFLEDKQQLLNQNQLFRRLNWTNKEAWFILPINEKQTLLAESHKLFLINIDQQKTEISALSDAIYPREIIQSRYNPKLFYVITELDVQLLLREEDSWQLKPFYSQRANSLIEEKSGSILMTIQGGGFYKLKLDIKTAEVLEKTEVSTDYYFDDANKEDTNLIFTNDKELYAYSSDIIYELNEGQPPEPLFEQLLPELKGEEINILRQSEDGWFYGFTAFNLFYQDAKNSWRVIDISPFLQGIIDGVRIIDDEIKILSNGTLITYLRRNNTPKEPIDFSLRMTKIEFKHNNIEQLLPLNPKQLISIDDKDTTLTFSFVLNDAKNHPHNLYRFKLQGESEEWSDFNNSGKIQISNLAIGEYALNIQAKDVNNQFYYMPIYRFVVNPPWYLTNQAILIWTLVSIMLLLGIFQWLLKWREKIHVAQKQELKQIINQKTQELIKANANLQKIAHLDGLTGLSNRFHLDEFIKKLTTNSANNIIVIMMDMDNFKQFNDKFGHLAGDDLLKLTARHLQQSIDSSNDIVARYGGEEFLAILVNKEFSYAQNKANKISQLIENKEKEVSVSIGICASKSETDLISIDAIYQLIDMADQALYQAKEAGRNKIVICD